MLFLLWTASTATPMPSMTVNPTSVTPGPWGFAAITVLAIAVVLLLLDMLRRVRRGRYRDEVREQLDAEEEAARRQPTGDTPPAADPDEPGRTGPRT